MTPGIAFALCFWLPFWIIVPVILVELGGLPERFARSTPIEMSPEWHIGAGTTHESAELMKMISKMGVVTTSIAEEPVAHSQQETR
jgi:hypothetical protein